MTKAKSLKNSILLYGNVIHDLSNRAAELKREEKEIINILKNEKLCAKKDRIEIAKMENVLKNIKISKLLLYLPSNYTIFFKMSKSIGIT